METKDLRYAPAQYTREHQRTFTVLDIAEGDSNVIVLSQALQYSDAVRAYDCSTLEDTAVTDAVSKWILTGESIWDTFEHLRLPIRVVDSQRIALPDGFVGRVLIARVTPDADAEAPELIRLGALLHRIQQEPTAAVVYKQKVKPVEPTAPIAPPEPAPDPKLPAFGNFNTALFRPAYLLQLPETLEYIPKVKPEIEDTKSVPYSMSELLAFWRDYERAQERMQGVMEMLRDHPNYSTEDVPYGAVTPYIIALRAPLDGLALNIRETRDYTYPVSYWCRVSKDSRYNEDTDCKYLSLEDLHTLPVEDKDLRPFMGTARYVKIPLKRISGVMLYLYLATRDSGLLSYIGTSYGEVSDIHYRRDRAHTFTLQYDSDDPNGFTGDNYVGSVASLQGYRTVSSPKESLAVRNFGEFLMDVSRSAQVRTGATITTEGSWNAREGKPIPPKVRNVSFLVQADSPSDAYRFVTPDTFEGVLNMPLGARKDDIPTFHTDPWNDREISNRNLPEGLMSFDMGRYVYVYNTDDTTYLLQPPTIEPKPKDMVGLLGYKQWEYIGISSGGSGVGYAISGTPNKAWVMDKVTFVSRNLYHLKGLYEKWQQLRKASEHSMSDSLSSS